ncbi:MAG: hypothetical protein ACXIUZ_02110 [Lysobacteraceae bacterium]
MGRSVSYATGAEWVLYATDVVPSDYECHLCETTGTDADGDACIYCDGTGRREADADDTGMAWEDFVDNLRHDFRAAFPSLSYCDEWLGREDRALLENQHARIGVSEYCGMVSVWCVPKDWDGWGRDTEVLSRHWCRSIETRAAAVLGTFATRLARLGTMSNGEGVYRRCA